MRTNQDCFAVRASVVAVRVALVAMAAIPVAYAADPAPLDPAVAELVQRSSQIEVGAGYVTDGSYKFGQYNGLYDKGLYGIINFDVRGGAPYNSDSATRWSITGTNLGLETRNATADYGNQGKFRIYIGFDELRSNYSDTYQTPFLGAGSNSLTLPSNWLAPRVPQVSTSNINFRSFSPTTGLANALVSGVVTAPTPAQQAQVNAIIANDVPDFQNVNLDTTRKTYSGGFSYNFDPRWELTASASQLQNNGLKGLSTVTSQVSEFAALIPNLIDQTTNQYNVALNYRGEKAFMQLAYYGSMFNNNVQSMTWQDVNDPTKSATMSSAPSNDFNQWILSGGYKFSPTTKLVMTGSYARATQNDAFLNDPTLPLGLPTSSPNALVETTAFNAKLTAKPVKGLNVAVGYKYDDRENRTPINTYIFQDVNEARSATPSPFNAALGLAPNTLGSNINIYANRPYSKELNQFNADADYALAKGQSLKAGYEYQQIDRTCTGSWINCADAPKTTENTLRVAWDANLVENWRARVSYAYSDRHVDYDENAFLALVPMANVIPVNTAGNPGAGATVSAYTYLLQTGLSGFGPFAAFPAVPLTGNAAIFSPNNNIVPQALYGSRNNINEEIGMRRYNMADRTRNKVRASVDWSATEQLSVQGGVEYVDDDFSNSVYGLQSAKNLALNLEANYAVSDNFSANAFYTYEELKSQSAGVAYGANSNTASVGGNTVVSGGCYATVLERNMNAKIDPCLNWSTDMKDKVNTFGVGVRYKGLMAGKLDLAGDVVYTDARTDIGVNGGSYVNNPYAVTGKPPVTPAVMFIPTANLPTVTNKQIELRLAGQYAIDGASALRAFYWYQRLKSTDYAYDGMQYGTITNTIPTNEQAPNYNVNVFGVSYIYRWR